MQIGMIGVGKMGGGMVQRLMRNKHECVVWARSAANVDAMVKKGAVGSTSLQDLVKKLAAPRTVWVMVPCGDATDSTINQLAECMSSGDTIIDGGNSNWHDDIRHAKMLAPKGIKYIDVGTSGGVWGLERGYCLMIGGETENVKRHDPIFKTLAPGMGEVGRTPGRPAGKGTAEQGYLHCGPAGAGHFVKMIHNGIEYGIMQAYAEGLDILKHAGIDALPVDNRYTMDLAEICELWRRGSVVGSWLLDLTASALIENPDLKGFTGFVQDSGEGRWTILAAIDEAVPCDVLTASLYTRFRSRQDHTFAEKVISAMRNKFGGHVEAPTAG